MKRQKEIAQILLEILEEPITDKSINDIINSEDITDMGITSLNLLAKLIQCILNSANGLVVNEVYVLQNGKCTNFANDSGKQTICYFRVVPDDQELVCKL